MTTLKWTLRKKVFSNKKNSKIKNLFHLESRIFQKKKRNEELAETRKQQETQRKENLFTNTGRMEQHEEESMDTEPSHRFIWTSDRMTNTILNLDNDQLKTSYKILNTKASGANNKIELLDAKIKYLESFHKCKKEDTYKLSVDEFVIWKGNETKIRSARGRRDYLVKKNNELIDLIEKMYAEFYKQKGKKIIMELVIQNQ